MAIGQRSGFEPGSRGGNVSDSGHAARVEVVAARFPRFFRERPLYDRVKRLADLVLAGVLLLATAPMIVIAACLVKATSRGPAFYVQRRVGRAGRVFTIYKIRTMIHECESLTGPRWAIPGDPRVTTVGRLLRLSHLDELPQLINVFCGDMSLVGPRPERPEFVRALENLIPGYRYRLLARPGLTGLAQVQLPSDSDLGSVRTKLAQDLYYLAMYDAWLDVRLLGCTLCRLLGLPFRWAGKLCGIPDTQTVVGAFRRAQREPVFEVTSAAA